MYPLGSDYKPITRHSLYMGCVSYTKRFFADGLLNRGNYERAKIAAEQEFQPLVQSFSNFGWRDAIGSSGTPCGIQEILEANNWGTGKITLEGLDHLREYLHPIEISDISINGLTKDRRPVIIVSGLAIVDAFFEIFGIDSMKTSKWSLREDVLSTRCLVPLLQRSIFEMRQLPKCKKLIVLIRSMQSASRTRASISGKHERHLAHLGQDENERLLRMGISTA